LQSKQETKEIVQRAKSLPPAMENKAVKDRIPSYAMRAMKNAFGSEQEVWDFLAEKAKEGSFAHLNMLFQYKYGKPVERETTNTQVKRNAPVINFINNQPNPSAHKEAKDDTIDITDTSKTDE